MFFHVCHHFLLFCAISRPISPRLFFRLVLCLSPPTIPPLLPSHFSHHFLFAFVWPAILPPFASSSVLLFLLSLSEVGPCCSLSPQVKGWMFISQNYYNDNKWYFIDPIVLSLCPWHLMTPWHFAGGTANWTAHPGVRRWLLIGHTWTRVPEVGLFCASQSRYFFPNSYLLYIRFMDLALC